MADIKKSIGAAKACCPQREPYWDELDADGKIERMRQIVRGLRGVNEKVGKLRYDFSHHKHTEHTDGEVYLPLIHGQGTAMLPPKDEDKYF